MRTATRRTLADEDRGLAQQIGRRLRAARLRAGLTQRELAEGRYTKAYVSALENGVVKPSMAALNFLAARLGTTASELLAGADGGLAASRLDADLWLASGNWQAALDAYQALLDRSGVGADRASIVLGCAEALCRLGRPTEALAEAAEAERLFGKAGNGSEVLAARYWLAAAHHASDNPERAREILVGLVDPTQDGDGEVDPDLRVRALIALGTVESHAGEHRRALTYLEEARGLAETLDDRRRATFLHSLALGYRGTGDDEAALRVGLQSLSLFRAAGARLEAASISNELALAYLAAGSLGRARDLALEARQLFKQIGDERWHAHALDTAALVELAADDLTTASELASDSLETARRSGNGKAELDALLTMARIERAAGRPDDALTRLEEAARVADDQPAGRRRDILVETAEVLAEAGRHAEAYEVSKEALALG